VGHRERSRYSKRVKGWRVVTSSNFLSFCAVKVLEDASTIYNLKLREVNPPFSLK
jgi:hypothetical protein